MMDYEEKQTEIARVGVIEDESRRFQALSYAIEISKSLKLDLRAPEELINVADTIEKYLKEGKIVSWN